MNKYWGKFKEKRKIIDLIWILMFFFYPAAFTRNWIKLSIETKLSSRKISRMSSYQNQGKPEVKQRKDLYRWLRSGSSYSTSRALERGTMNATTPRIYPNSTLKPGSSSRYGSCVGECKWPQPPASILAWSEKLSSLPLWWIQVYLSSKPASVNSVSNPSTDFKAHRPPRWRSSTSIPSTRWTRGTRSQF